MSASYTGLSHAKKLSSLDATNCFLSSGTFCHNHLSVVDLIYTRLSLVATFMYCLSVNARTFLHDIFRPAIEVLLHGLQHFACVTHGSLTATRLGSKAHDSLVPLTAPASQLTSFI